MFMCRHLFGEAYYMRQKEIAEIGSIAIRKCMRAMDWNHIRAFHATATAGTLSAAARRLGLTQPTLSRLVLAREAELGVVLADRTP
jgi:hypothetical protein